MRGLSQHALSRGMFSMEHFIAFRKRKNLLLRNKLGVIFYYTYFKINQFHFLSILNIISWGN